MNFCVFILLWFFLVNMHKIIFLYFQRFLLGRPALLTQTVQYVRLSRALQKSKRTFSIDSKFFVLSKCFVFYFLHVFLCPNVTRRSEPSYDFWVVLEFICMNSESKEKINAFLESKCFGSDPLCSFLRHALTIGGFWQQQVGAECIGRSKK